MEPVLIECTLCHKRYNLDLGKMREMGVTNPACPACKTPLPVDLSPVAIPRVGEITGAIKPDELKRIVAQGQAEASAHAQAATEATAELASDRAHRAINTPPTHSDAWTKSSQGTPPTHSDAWTKSSQGTPPPVMAAPSPAPYMPPAPMVVSAPAEPVSPQGSFQADDEPDFDAPDVGEATISSAMMASQLAKANKLPEGYNFTVSCIDGPAAGKKISMDNNRCVIGRRKGDFILTGDGEASSEHAVIDVRSMGNYFVNDLGSTNGTFLNDKKISGPTPLNDRDIVRVGSCTLLFVVTVKEDEIPVTAPVPPVLAPPPGAGAAGSAPLPPPSEAVIPDLPAFLPKPTPVPPNYRFYLKFMEGDMTGEVFEMKGGRGYSMGRSRDCDVPLGDIKASRVHARIFILGVDKYFTQDLTSTNGTFLNEQKVLDVLPLKNQDVIRVGLTKMKFIVLKLPPGQQTM